MRVWTVNMRKPGWLRLALVLPLINLHLILSAQAPACVYTIKNGKMYVHISRNLKEPSLDSFITRFSLQELAVKEFLTTGFSDSLKKYGWEVVVNNQVGVTFTKPLEPYDIDNPSERIRLAEKHGLAEDGFAPVSSKIPYGVNKFRNKSPFAIRDSVVTFFLRNNQLARKVMLAGSFNSWKPDATEMTRTDSGWIASVNLSPGKYWYKFVIDGKWTIDQDNWINENDGRGNTNSVFYFPNTLFSLEGYTTARKVYLAGSFNEWEKHHLAMIRTIAGWVLPMYLADGTHTYKFIVDGQWYTDPANPDKFPNEFNDFNSVRRIGKPYIFRLNGYEDAKEVVLTGSFNKWKKRELFMRRSGKGWELEYTLGPGNYEYDVLVDGKEIKGSQDLLTVNNQARENSIFILDANYTFRLKGFSTAKQIYLAGDFNDWKPSSLLMRKEGDEWVFRVHLSPGKHLYKFIVDGAWIIDPGNKLWEENEFGTGNSVIWIDQ